MGLFSCFTGCGFSKAKELVGTVAEPIEKRRFLEAAKDGNEDRFTASLEEHPDLMLSHSLANGKTAAHLAAESGHIHILEALTESLLCNASKLYGKEGSGQEPAEAIMPSLINAIDAEGRTPLSLASEHGHVDCARFLLANGADRLIADHKGNTTLHYASWKCHLG
ncbi:ankyrin repeat-containing domain protein [Dunaliella salina]|uniref:Ankyrin repeat-containing domain protein n=1 Tax=Dunaliella salina TaxID=3046 RepID=A0ABQ7GR46_DUNSA|nr:ankyrin repeat-containing domain protein [Dunaliella salina]|eukprot:KAF5837067.1 ankyrin repeat-containing domain protein [Dunaliella salina]